MNYKPTKMSTLRAQSHEFSAYEGDIYYIDNQDEDHTSDEQGE